MLINKSQNCIFIPLILFDNSDMLSRNSLHPMSSIRHSSNPPFPPSTPSTQAMHPVPPSKYNQTVFKVSYMHTYCAHTFIFP
ncbi:hypothetical protein EYC84_012094 [Monilinia fructicola]|uniref:Uncharacterized protein n=1 Tax=Monilinia fructicola TaxID=38448 RepID=A0A5M9J776_MONFR|nr:hypothetical protein EYC84_012094 [Monilinia fructicola]